jgi:hypothetical protein
VAGELDVVTGGTGGAATVWWTVAGAVLDAEGLVGADDTGADDAGADDAGADAGREDVGTAAAGREDDGAETLAVPLGDELDRPFLMLAPWAHPASKHPAATIVSAGASRLVSRFIPGPPSLQRSPDDDVSRSRPDGGWLSQRSETAAW